MKKKLRNILKINRNHKIKIRFGFETDSSSSHSLSIKKDIGKREKLDVRDEEIYSHFGEFGWEWKKYSDPKTKLSYVLTMVAETEMYWRDKENSERALKIFEKTKGYHQIKELIKEKTGCDLMVLLNVGSYYPFGYIDHQSSTDEYGSLQDFLDDWGITLERFIFDPNIVLRTGNDNDDPHWERD